MKTPKFVTAMAVAVLAIATQSSQAEMANGTYSIPLGSTIPLWDISGSYDFSEMVPWADLLGTGTVTAGHGYALSIDPSGKFSGSDKISYDDATGNSVNGSVSMKGLVKDSRVSMKVSLSGSAIIGSGLIANVDFGASAVVTFSLDGSGHRLLVKCGSAKLTAKDYNSGKKRSRTIKISKGTVITLPVKVTGDWNLNLHLTPNGTAYNATATVETSTGATLALTGTGVYKSKTDTSKIMLKGPGSTLCLEISTAGTAVKVQSINGKMFGQTIKL